jgi:hypothetical protein
LAPILASYRRRLPPSLATTATLDALLGDGGTEVLVAEDAEWAYLRGGVQPPEGLEWTRADFDDRGWERGESPLGYGLAYFPATRLDDMPGSYDSIRARVVFEIPDPGAFRELRLQVWADNGFIAYLDGAEVGCARLEPPSHLKTFSWSPSHAKWGARPLPHLVRIDGGRLSAGKSCLALLGRNHPGSRQGFYLQAILVGDLRPDAGKARALLEDLRREAPGGEDGGPEGRARILYVEGRRLELEGRLQEATEKLRELAGLDPGEPLPHLRLAQALRRGRRLAEAEEALRGALPRFPERRDLWDLWHEIAAGDLKLSPEEMLLGFGSEIQARLEGHGADVIWLLSRLAADGAVRVNCGGGEHTDSAGDFWGRDCFFLGGMEVADEVETGPQEELPLDHTHRVFTDKGAIPGGYRIPLPPGEYRVDLRFSENWLLKPGHHVFDIQVEGEEVARQYEPISAGFARSDVKTWSGRVRDGFLDVALVPRVERPAISAVQIVRVR